MEQTIQSEALTIKDLAKVLNISTKTCYKLVKNDLIPHVMIGSTYRIPKAAVLALLESGDKIELRVGC